MPDSILERLDDPDWLHRRYVDEGATLMEIGAELGCGHLRVLAALERGGIDRRPRGIQPIHGHTVGGRATPTYRIWRSMLHRTSNPQDKKFPNYGGRGIGVCDRWRDFENFLADMGERPDGMSLDRIDNDDGYYPENCRWADATTQNRNRRRCCPNCGFDLTERG